MNDRILHVIDRPEGARVELSHDVLIQVVERSRLERAAKKEVEAHALTQAAALRRRFRQVQVGAAIAVAAAAIVSVVWLIWINHEAAIANGDLAARQQSLTQMMVATDDLRDAAAGLDSQGRQVDPPALRKDAVDKLDQCARGMGPIAAKRPTTDNRTSLALCEYNLGNALSDDGEAGADGDSEAGADGIRLSLISSVRWTNSCRSMAPTARMGVSTGRAMRTSPTTR